MDMHVGFDDILYHSGKKVLKRFDILSVHTNKECAIWGLNADIIIITINDESDILNSNTKSVKKLIEERLYGFLHIRILSASLYKI